MRVESFCIIEYENQELDKIVDLFNKWHTATSFRSVGNTTGEEWEALREYCLEPLNMNVVLKFAKELFSYSIKPTDNSQEGFGWMFLQIVEEVFNKDKQLFTYNGYIPPLLCMKLWLVVLSNWEKRLEDFSKVFEPIIWSE